MRSGSPAIAVASAALVAILNIYLPTLAHAQIRSSETVPFAYEVANPCVAEPVFVEGQITTATYHQPDSSGGNHFTFRIIMKGKGTGLASPFEPAKEYVLSSESILEINAPSSGTYEDTGVLNSVFVRKSESDTALEPIATGDDFMEKTTAHITISNGVPRVGFTRGQRRCM